MKGRDFTSMPAYGDEPVPSSENDTLPDPPADDSPIDHIQLMDFAFRRMLPDFFQQENPADRPA